MKKYFLLVTSLLFLIAPVLAEENKGGLFLGVDGRYSSLEFKDDYSDTKQIAKHGITVQ